MSNFKTEKHRDKKWLMHQRQSPCVFTGSDTVEVAHIRKGTNTGISQKPHDYYTLPIDYRLHKEQHQHGEITFYQTQANEYPLTTIEAFLAMSKLSYLVWLVREGREKEAIDLLK